MLKLDKTGKTGPKIVEEKRQRTFALLPRCIVPRRLCECLALFICRLNVDPQSTGIYLEYHSVCPLFRIGTPPPPLPQASVPPPPPTEPKGAGSQGTHSLASEGAGESHFGRLEKKPGTLSTLWLNVRGCKEIFLLKSALFFPQNNQIILQKFFSHNS